jgi:hypothetical protein
MVRKVKGEPSEKMNPFLLGRQQRLQEILDFVREHNPCEYTYILGVFGLKWGAAEQTIKKYLKTLENAKMIVVDEYANRISLAKE